MRDIGSDNMLLLEMLCLFWEMYLPTAELKSQPELVKLGTTFSEAQNLKIVQLNRKLKDLKT